MGKESGFSPAGQEELSAEKDEPVRPQTEKGKEVYGAEKKEERVRGAAEKWLYQEAVEEETERGEDGARRESVSKVAPPAVPASGSVAAAPRQKKNQ